MTACQKLGFVAHFARVFRPRGPSPHHPESQSPSNASADTAFGSIVLVSLIVLLPKAIFKVQAGLPGIRIRDLLQCLVLKVKASFDKPQPHPLAEEPLPELNTFSDFPFWPRLRPSASYKANPLALSREETCSKAVYGHNRLTHGLVFFLCPHSLVYGYSFMAGGESPGIIFQELYQRFPKAPSTIIYDFACKLDAYCQAREPAFFSKTQICVDRFHWRNHKACSLGYSLSEYKADPLLCQLNSSACEQWNSRVKLLRKALSYMTPDNFKLALKLFITLRNRCTNEKQ